LARAQWHKFCCALLSAVHLLLTTMGQAPLCCNAPCSAKQVHMIPAMFAAECPRTHCPLSFEEIASAKFTGFTVRQAEARQEEVLPQNKLLQLPRISEVCEMPSCVASAFLCRETSMASDRDKNISAPLQPSWPVEGSVLSGFEYGVSWKPMRQPSFPEALVVTNSKECTSTIDAIMYFNPIGAESLGATEIDVDALDRNLMLCESDADLPLCERRGAKSLTHWYEDDFDDASTKAATPQEDCSDASSNSSHSGFISRDPVLSTSAETRDASKSLHSTGTASTRTEVFFLFDPSAPEESVEHC